MVSCNWQRALCTRSLIHMLLLFDDRGTAIRMKFFELRVAISRLESSMNELVVVRDWW